MDNRPKATFKTVINAPVVKIWDALTNPALVKQYFFGTNLETDWKVGSPIYFSGVYEGKPYKDKGVVLEYSPNKSLSYSYWSNWSGMPDVEENYLTVEYGVKELDGGTELTITQTNYDSEKASHSEANWKSLTDELRKLVER
jgi:uncharacterized protein YndB with AHSA1/START domain